MSRAKIKMIKKTMGDSDGKNINSLFEEMMGVKDCDTNLIIPKFVSVRNTCKKIYKILIQFTSFNEFKENFPDFKDDINEIELYANNMKADIALGDSDEKEEKYEKLDKKEMNNLYRKIKENKYVKQLVVLCSRLKQFKSYIGEASDLKDGFIAQEPGLSFKVFGFSNFDLKKFWIHDNIKPITKKYILSILHHLFKETYNLYQILTSPNVDIQQFSSMLIESLSQIKKHPELSRCNNAFKKIENGIDMLKGNFNDYYRQSVASENPNMILESFIIDLSNQNGSDAKVVREFRTIIQFMHKMSKQSGKDKDPNLQKIFKMLNSQFSSAENPPEKTPEDTTDVSLKDTEK